MSFPQFQRFVLVCSLLVAAPFAQAGSRQIDASLLSTPSFERMSSSAGFGITANAATGAATSSDALQAVSAREAEERKAARQDDAASMAVPEPSSYLLLLAGLLAVGFVARRRGTD